MNRTLLDECFRIRGRTNWYQETSEVQADLDRYLTYYNLERSNQAHRLKPGTPAQALREALGVKKLPNLDYQTDSQEDAINEPEAT